MPALSLALSLILLMPITSSAHGLAGKFMELGIAAEIPINSKSGKSVGILGLIHLFAVHPLTRGRSRGDSHSYGPYGYARRT